MNDSMQPKIVCLCGSTRFYAAFQEANYQETLAGNIVLSVGFYPHAQKEMHGEDIGISPEQKIALDELHKNKIDLADEVYVLNVEGYIGQSTASEIAYAEKLGKPIRWLEPQYSELQSAVMAARANAVLPWLNLNIQIEADETNTLLILLDSIKEKIADMAICGESSHPAGNYRFDISEIASKDEQLTIKEQHDTELSLLSDEDWQEANRRVQIISPLLGLLRRTKKVVAAHARAAGIHHSTLYRWIETYERSGLVSALLPGKRGYPQGKLRLSQEVEAIVSETIEDFYLHKQKRSKQDTCNEVRRRCRDANVPPPHPNTVRKRIALISK